MTPLGTPVEPLVYIIMARSSPRGEVAEQQWSEPRVTTSLKECTSTLRVSRPARGHVSVWSWMTITCRMFGHRATRLRNLGRRLEDVTTTDTSVSLKPWQMASSPRLVYTVDTTMLWEKAPSAARIHSARVSA